MNSLANFRPHPNTTAFYLNLSSIYILSITKAILLASAVDAGGFEYYLFIPLAVFIFWDVLRPLYKTKNTGREYTPQNNQLMPSVLIRTSKENANYAVDLGLIHFICLKPNIIADPKIYENVCGHEYAHILFKDGMFSNGIKLMLYIIIFLITYVFVNYDAGIGDQVAKAQYVELFLELILLGILIVFFGRKSIHTREYNADFLSLSINGFSYIDYMNVLAKNAHPAKQNFSKYLKGFFTHPDINERIHKLDNPNYFKTSYILSIAVIYFVSIHISNSLIGYMNSFPFEEVAVPGSIYNFLKDNILARQTLILFSQLCIFYYVISELLILSLSAQYITNTLKFIIFYIAIGCTLLLFGVAFSSEIRAVIVIQHGDLLTALAKMPSSAVTPFAFVLSTILVKNLFRVKRYHSFYVILIFFCTIFAEAGLNQLIANFI